MRAEGECPPNPTGRMLASRVGQAPALDDHAECVLPSRRTRRASQAPRRPGRGVWPSGPPRPGARPSQVIRCPPSHGSAHSWSAAPNRFSTRTFATSHPKSSLTSVKYVTRSSSAISFGQLLSGASSASDRNRTGMRHAIWRRPTPRRGDSPVRLSPACSRALRRFTDHAQVECMIKFCAGCAADAAPPTRSA